MLQMIRFFEALRGKSIVKTKKMCYNICESKKHTLCVGG